MISVLAALCCVRSAAAEAPSAGLTLSVFGNTALSGKPATTSVIASSAASFLGQAGPFSAEITGTLVADVDAAAATAATATSSYTFDCDFTSTTLALLHVDGHLVCSSGTNSPSGTTIYTDQPLPVLSKTQLPFRLGVVFNGSHANPHVNVTVHSSKVDPLAATATAAAPQCTDFMPNSDFPGNDLRGIHNVATKEDCCALCANDTRCAGGSWDGPDSPWSDKTCNLKHATPPTKKRAAKGMFAFTVRAPTPAPAPPPTPPPPPHPTPGPPGPPAVFAPSLPVTEVQRATMQAGLAEGWGLWWQMSFMKHVRLPEGQALTIHLCDLHAKTCNAPVRSGSPTKHRLGYHAVDRSYGQLHVLPSEGEGSCNVSITFGGGDTLLARVASVGPGCEHYAAVATGSGVWYRDSQVTAKPSALSFVSVGLRSSEVSSTRPHNASLDPLLPAEVTALPHIAVSLAGGGSLGLSSDPAVTTDEDLLKTLHAAEQAELARYAAYGALSETKAAVQAAVMWLTVYCPVERGPLSNIIRGNAFGLDWHTQNDDWAYVIFDWDNTFAAMMLSFDSADLGFSALIQLVKSKTADGFIPNWATPQHKRTWSQPPIASRVLHEMVMKHKNSNTSWVVELLFDDLLDWNQWFNEQRRLLPLNITCLGGPDSGSKGMQEGRWESGLDNSPMYDPWPGDFVDGKMQLYDTGMASMHVMDTDALAALAKLIGRPEATMLQKRADEMRALIEAHLWDDEAGIYTNVFSANQSFNKRYSPTNFYPMIGKGPSNEHVDRMSTQWLMNSTRFCISPTGDFAGNTDECYWGLPSISADDPAFPALGYWRGFVWGPMAMLTYWGLDEYREVPSAVQARVSLSKQMNAMMLKQWNDHGYICENYGPHKNTSRCTGQSFYHWGALTGFLSLIEAGHWV